jgi:hypothetical protein
MALAPFFFRTYMAIGAHAGINRDELEQILSTQVIRVAVGEACVADGNEQWIAELLVNLLARLYPVLSVEGPEAFTTRLSALARSINPDIEIRECVPEATITVFVGTEITSTRGIAASASGWVTHVGRDQAQVLVGGPRNPYSSGAAASLAASRVFEVVVLQKDLATLADIALSLLDYGESAGIGEPLTEVDLGEVAVVGIGAVGNPAIWAWSRHARLMGHLHLVDPENVEISNLQRYVLPLFEDREEKKVQLAHRELQGTLLSVELWDCRLDEFADRHPSIRALPTICVSVDNVTDRRVAQALLPRLLVNGWTSKSGLGASWHRFAGDPACLGCLYHPTRTIPSQTEMAADALGIPHRHLADLWVSEKPLELAEIQMVEAHLQLPGQLGDWVGKRVQDVYSGVICGHIGIDLPTIGRLTTVPLAHQSVLAGILMAAELVKRSDQTLESMSQQHTLVKWDDILAGPPPAWTAMRKKVSGCFCQDNHYLDIYHGKWMGAQKIVGDG